MNAQATETFTCADCGIVAPAWCNPEGPTTSAYLTRRNGDKICADCAEREDRERIAKGDRVFGYVSSGATLRGASWEGVHGRALGRVTWVGGEVANTRRGPWGVRNYLRVVMFDGSVWHGTGANGLWCSLRKRKAVQS